VNTTARKVSICVASKPAASLSNEFISTNNKIKMEQDRVICNCLDIYKSTIVKAIKEQGLKTVDEVGESTEAGTVCGTCQDEIQEILDEING
jgi:bacterioferritin-associated ferredoxin